jgi:hypothetical protein
MLKKLKQYIFAAALLAAFLLFAACEQPAGVERDEDATLRTLSVDRGTLSPAFNESHFQYSVAVRNANDAITVTATANSGRATVSGAGTKTLSIGSNNIITVNVKSESGVSKTYTITVTRASVKEIETAQDMAKIGVDEEWSLTGDYILVNNITLENWRGVAENSGEIFSGGFDGGGKTITLNGLALSGNSVSMSGVSPLAGSNLLMGIFCRVEGSPSFRAEIKNLTVVVNALVDEDPQSHMSVGVVAGYAKETDFENITIKGNISARNAYTTGARPGNRRLYLGGIAGSVEASSITGCRNEAAIYGFGKAYSAVYNQIGGIAGMFYNNVNIKDCHNTGNISGETTDSASNVFVGGIAGGSFYYTNTNYRGVIEDCSSTGDIHSEGAAFWSWAGGIAGVVVGSGTKVVRSHASGTISVNGPAGSWPYVGGITGYNYYGSVIEQCYFTGEVEVQGGDVVSDYAGGIAGYNSQAPTANSIIQDCWSAGRVTGFLNAGGIAGQNQAYTNLRRCYSTAEIIAAAPPDARANLANSGAGGIAGFSVSTEKDGITANVALNTSISAPNGFPVLGRVVGTNSAAYVAGGYKDEGGSIKNNYAGSGTSVTIAGEPKEITADINGIDGADCDDKPTQAFYVSLGWDFTDVWTMGNNGYPQLKWQQ